MQYLFLVLLFVALLGFNWLFNNAAIIAAIMIVPLIISIIVQFTSNREDSKVFNDTWDFGEVLLLLLKIAGIIFCLYLIFK